MMNRILLLLPLISLLFLAGCNEGYENASGRPPSAAPASAQAPAKPSPSAIPATTAVSQSAPAQLRMSTTQPLPPGYGYVNERELISMTRQ